MSSGNIFIGEGVTALSIITSLYRKAAPIIKVLLFYHKGQHMSSSLNFNRLKSEHSLYLRQHKDNPIHWWSYGPEALGYAQKTNKPIFLSIGYSSCHWCHVMAHEAFSDQSVADFLNENFTCIKVDREEFPQHHREHLINLQTQFLRT